MIKVDFITDGNKLIGVQLKNHAEPIVCSAVSALVLNCANSIESFTDAGFRVEGDFAEGGDLSLVVTEFDDEGRAQLLLDSLVLGLSSVAEQYSTEITITK